MESEEPQSVVERRKRIELRQRAKEGKNINEEIAEFNEAAIETQLQESADVLATLTLESNDAVGSIKVAGEMRKEVQGFREGVKREQRQQILAAEARNSWQRVETITAKWTSAEGVNDALRFDALLAEQKSSCEAVLAQKEAMVVRLKGELEEREALYQQTLKEQWHDLRLASDRVDQQVSQLQYTQRDELALLEAVTARCRSEQMGLGDERWADLWQTLQRTLASSADQRQDLRQDLALDEDLLHDKLAECVHCVRLQLQTQSQDLGLQLQELQASCILNAEKMKLNIEILRTRDQEAKVFRAEQKKKISRLQERVRSAQAEFRQQQNEANRRRKNLSSRVCKLKAENAMANAASGSTSVTKTQLKMITEHFAKQASQLVNKLLLLDERIHAEQLCVEWRAAPDLQTRLSRLTQHLCESAAPTSTESSSSEALHEASSLLTAAAAEDNDCDQIKRFLLTTFLSNTLPFLAPENANLKTKSPEEKTLLDLAACLSALGIETDSELDELFDALLRQTKCAACGQMPFNSKATCDSHSAYLDANGVLTAVKKFSHNSLAESHIDHIPSSRQSVSELLLTKSPSLLKSHRGWHEFLQLLPDDLEDKWDKLLDGLNQHLAVLQDRHEVNAQVGRIKTQNDELRHLLEMHTVAKLQRKN